MSEIFHPADPMESQAECIAPADASPDATPAAEECPEESAGEAREHPPEVPPEPTPEQLAAAGPLLRLGIALFDCLDTYTPFRRLPFAPVAHTPGRPPSPPPSALPLKRLCRHHAPTGRIRPDKPVPHPHPGHPRVFTPDLTRLR